MILLTTGLHFEQEMWYISTLKSITSGINQIIEYIITKVAIRRLYLFFGPSGAVVACVLGTLGWGGVGCGLVTYMYDIPYRHLRVI